MANTGGGITIDNSPGNFIGGTDPGSGNIISANTGNGILIGGAGSTDNVVQGNLIGTTNGGDTELGNSGSGVRIDNSIRNLIGGISASQRNVISGNGTDGISIAGSTSTENLVKGNFIGVNALGTALLANTSSGVGIEEGSGNTIGGPEPEARNVISGNGTNVTIRGANARDNHLIGNFIGTDVSGEYAIAPISEGAGIGVFVQDGPDNVIGPGNVISGNQQFGVQIKGEEGHWAGSTSVIGNLVGTNISGGGPVPNGVGVQILRAVNNRIGWQDPGEGNLISGNGEGVVVISNDDVYRADGNFIRSNKIGTDISGTSAIPNQTKRDPDSTECSQHHHRRSYFRRREPDLRKPAGRDPPGGICTPSSHNPDPHDYSRESDRAE